MKRNGIFENQWKTNQNIIIMYLKEQEKLWKKCDVIE